jgi:amidase
VFTEPVVPIDFDIRGPDELKRVGDALALCTATSFTGVPAVAVPTHVASGLPQGVQLIAGAYREDLCLAAAAIIEARLGTFTPINPVN